MRISDWSSDVCSSDLTVTKVTREYRRERLKTRRKAGSKVWLKARDRALSMTEVFNPPGAAPQDASRLPWRPFTSKRGRVARIFAQFCGCAKRSEPRTEGTTSELQSLMRTTYAVFYLKKTIIIQ